jgi:uncharacterized protein
MEGQVAIGAGHERGAVEHGKIPQLSAQLFSIPLEPGRYVVYAPLRRAAFVANATVVNFLADLREGIFDAAADPDGMLVEFLRRLEIVDGGPEAPPITTFRGDPEPTAVTLFLTTACNLRCTYCYASAGDTPTKFMKLDVAKRGIDFVAANAARKRLPAFEVAYHGGGEPSVNWHTMIESFAYARERAAALGINAVGVAATNGVLNATQIDWMIAHFQGVSLSFDGLPAVHDRHRIMINGSGSSSRVMHTIRRFEEAHFRYGLRVTVTRDQILSLPDSIEFVCKNFNPQRIQVEPAYQLGRWTDAPSAETTGFIDAYREAQRRAHSFGREITYSAARVDTLTNHFCGITQDNFCLSPDGNVSACYETFSEQNAWAKVFFYGKPDGVSGYAFDLTALEHLRHQGVENRPYCGGCFAKWHCAGDCHHKALTVNGGDEFAGSDRCHITRELTKDQILARVAEAGGWFWHEPPEDNAARAQGKELL